jgi:hypothetical protein
MSTNDWAIIVFAWIVGLYIIGRDFIALKNWYRYL